MNCKREAISLFSEKWHIHIPTPIVHIVRNYILSEFLHSFAEELDNTTGVVAGGKKRRRCSIAMITPTSCMRVATWNVLADCYAGNGCDWEHRSKQIESILTLLEHHDFIVLQEVDHFDDFYQPLFHRLGFGTRYIQRPTKNDGCLVAYALAKYEVIDVEHILFDDLASNYLESHSTRNSFLRHNVAIVVLLRVIQRHHTLSHIIVGSVHIYWNPVGVSSSHTIQQ